MHLLFLCYSQFNFYFKFLTSGVSPFFQATINYTKEDSAYETQTSFSMNLTGPIDYGFRNDYMFRAALQLSQKALIGLISSLLHLPPSAIKSVTITNPITLGCSRNILSSMLHIDY